MGKLIVIEGTDGSGKGTQLKLLVSFLEKRQISHASFDFSSIWQDFFWRLCRPFS